jgi:hypothetical protein
MMVVGDDDVGASEGLLDGASVGAAVGRYVADALEIRMSMNSVEFSSITSPVGIARTSLKNASVDA